MARRFAELTFGPSVLAAQQENGAARVGRMADGESRPDVLSPRETHFIAARDTFFLSSVSERGWPYVQHRGGPKGLLKVLDERTLAFADFSGNRQYLSVGNIAADDRVMLLLVDQARPTRLKLWGRARTVERDADPELIDAVSDDAYGAHVERAIVIEVEAIDWNCPQHITPRLTAEEWAQFAQ